MENTFKKVHTIKDLTISAILIAAGIGLSFLNTGLGITIGVCGLLCLLLYKSGYKKDGQGICLEKFSEDICKSCRASVMDFLAGKDVTPDVRKGNEGGSVRLDVYFNRAARVAYAQLFDFCNYAYEPASEIVEFHSTKADKLISLIK